MSRMRTPRIAPRVDRRALFGLLIVAIAGTAVYFSYGALQGLPGQKITHLTVEVPDAKQLSAGDQVRIGGARVGVVHKITGERGRKRPFARIDLRIFGNRRLPIDSKASITPISILGGKSVELIRGKAEQTLPDGATLPLSQGVATVDLNDALSTFDPQTRRGLQGTIAGFGEGVAGRGVTFNALTASLRPLMDPLRRVSLNLASPRTDLPGFVRGAFLTATALRPVTNEFADLLGNTATTFEAINAADPALAQVIEELPATETRSTITLRRATPVLSDLAALTRGLEPAANLLPSTSRNLTGALRTGVPTLDLTRATVPGTRRLIRELGASVPPRSNAVRDNFITLNDTVTQVNSILSTLLPAQERCNLLGTLLRNTQGAVSEGDAQAGWINFGPMFTSPVLLPSGAQTGEIHRNYQPIADERGCTVAKEPFVAGRSQTGNPTPTASHEYTSPPPAATQRARGTDLLTPARGTRVP